MTPATVINLIHMAIDHVEAFEPIIADATKTPAGVQTKISNVLSDVHSTLDALMLSENDAAVAKPLVQRIVDDLTAVAKVGVLLPPPAPEISLALQVLIPAIGAFAPMIWPTK